MHCLAIECSSAVGSVALLEGDEVTAQREWTGRNRGNGPLFDALKACVGRLPGRYADVDVFAVGRGPGNYSGMRAALAAAQALALPDGCPVIAVSSGAAAALQIARQREHTGPVRIVGDARRGQWWAGGFEVGRAAPEMVADWRLLAPDELRGLLSPGEVVATPEWDRIGETLRACAGPEADVVTEPVFPSAAAVGALAVGRCQRGQEGEPLRPLYMHPPVAKPVTAGADG